MKLLDIATLLALIMAVSSCATMPGSFQPTPTVDSRGFIDVWQLRRDVAEVESLMPSTDLAHCLADGDKNAQYLSEMPPLYTDTRSICIEKIQRSEAAYQRTVTAFNEAWMPVMLEAVRKGDVVTEVILRQCTTTQVLDHSQIESTCDQEPQRQVVAVQRLKEIGFAPAYDMKRERLPVVDGRISAVDAQKVMFDRFQHGIFPIDETLKMRWEAPEKNVEGLEVLRRDKVIDAAVQEAPRAFILPIPQYATLRLNRSPRAPNLPTWGRRDYGGVDTKITSIHFWRSGPYKIDPVYGDSAFASKDDYRFLTQLHELLTATESNIDRYLKQDPRWAVFLLHRIGHHEWVPEGMESDLGNLDSKWLGRWELYKTYDDFKEVESAPVGVSVISDGETTTATFQSNDASSSANQSGAPCRLRYSGGVTNLPPDDANGVYLMNAVLGFRPLTSEQLLEEKRDLFGPFAPLDRKTRYPQVLVQCPEGEWFDTDRARFMLLAGDTLLEVIREQEAGSSMIIRHYRRAKLTLNLRSFPSSFALYNEGEPLLLHLAEQAKRAQTAATNLPVTETAQPDDSLKQTKNESMPDDRSEMKEPE